MFDGSDMKEVVLNLNDTKEVVLGLPFGVSNFLVIVTVVKFKWQWWWFLRVILVFYALKNYHDGAGDEECVHLIVIYYLWW